MIIHENLGRATIGDQPPSNSMAPLDTLVPVALAGDPLPVLAFSSHLESGDEPFILRAGRSSQPTRDELGGVALGDHHQLAPVARANRTN